MTSRPTDAHRSRLHAIVIIGLLFATSTLGDARAAIPSSSLPPLPAPDARPLPPSLPRHHCLPRAGIGRPIHPSVRALLGLAGRYRLVVVATEGAEAGVRTAGVLVLRPVDRVHRYFTLAVGWPSHESPTVTFPLAGWSDVDLRAVGGVSLRWSPRSRDPERPGAQLDRRGALVFGDAVTPKGGVVLDMGVDFQILHLTRRGFTGTWANGGNFVPVPAGYFCAVRLSRDSTAR